MPPIIDVTSALKNASSPVCSSISCSYSGSWGCNSCTPAPRSASTSGSVSRAASPTAKAASYAAMSAPDVLAASTAASCSSILAFSVESRSISCCKSWFILATISTAASSAIGCPPRYCSSKRSFGVKPESSFGITSARRSIISPASCKALAFAD